jgi:hypothetical protein
VIEVKETGLFLEWAIKGGCAINCNSLVDFVNQNVIPKTADKTPGHKKVLQKPIDRIMEQFGSDSNLDVFRLVSKALNKLKGDIGPCPLSQYQRTFLTSVN